MAAIYLIRHGQASFGKADYDKLSEKGCQQSEILGEYLGPLITANKYYAGDLLRHNQTLRHFTEGANQSGVSMVTHSGFNEFDHLEVLARYDERWLDPVKVSAEISELTAGNKMFQQHFAAAMDRWISADAHNTSNEYKESWSDFKSRCVKALQDVINQYLTVKNTVDGQPTATDVLIFTSGGPIAAIIQHVLGLTDAQMLMINQQLRNTGVTKLLFSEANLSVDYFNNYNHLESKGSEWTTYR